VYLVFYLRGFTFADNGGIFHDCVEDFSTFGWTFVCEGTSGSDINIQCRLLAKTRIKMLE
jgi:hypothetical protein